ncbi:hypothetical protein JYG23_08235 [Sedimentibacter sp. zth1]|uniref:hypothetical protein n=1 Tax=Sedimentibacter sp. zth1 TaxID=2816908 RepID=UPI001A91A853|nr:hypothetical protein [Sedimentibacter sp. zth1]QSX04696.1 hypothetical protein JYG23_08235 [Sedimentibacter sp. zth1]
MLLKSKNIAYLGVLLALNQMFIIISSIIKTNTLLLFGIAALIVGIVIVEFGVKSGIVFYIASCILGFLLTTDKIEIITYISLFGLYSIVKYAIEKLVYNNRKNVFVELLLKFIFFNAVAITLYFVLKQFVMIKLFWWVIVLGEVGFLIYDYAFSVFINYYIMRIKPKIKR